ncbi:MAG: 3-deoxy-7-phosphoheptulonate synthase [Bdellovibrionota bacterium]
MFVVMKPNHSATDLKQVLKTLAASGFEARISATDDKIILNIEAADAKPLSGMFVQKISALSGVQDVVLAERKAVEKEIQVGNVIFGAGRFAVIAGPCAVESEAQTLRIAHAVKAAGAHVLRGGAFKPRTSPHSFQGLGPDGLKILDLARQETGLPIVTEVLDVRSVEVVSQFADLIQIGARNMQNYTLLKEVARQKKPVLLKRGMSATIDEWLMAADYILSGGNENVILCERGIRHFDKHTRFLLDLSAVPVVRSMSALPVIVDPSHASGRRDLIAPLARASLAAGASAVMIDVHDRPHEALCDGPQALLPAEFALLMESLRAMAPALNCVMDAENELRPFSALQGFASTPVGYQA